MNNTFWCYIPARNGSMRLPGKNFLRFVHGKCLTDLAIEMALELDLFEYIVIDTDNREYAELVKLMYPTIRIHRRSDKYAGGNIPTQVSLNDVLLKVPELREISNILILQPTSPMRRKLDIQKAVSKFVADPGLELLVSVTDPIISAGDLLTVDENGIVDNPDTLGTKKKVYFETGQFYIVNKDRLSRSLNPFKVTHSSQIFITDPKYFIDIDFQYQFELAQVLYNGLVVKTHGND